MSKRSSGWLAGLLACASPIVCADALEDRSLAEQIRAFTSKSDAGLVALTDASGGIGVDLDGRFRHVHLATLGEQGELRAQCVGSLAEANRFLGRDLDTGAKLAPVATPTDIDNVAALHGMSAAEYARIWNLIEQAKAQPAAPASSTFTIVNADGANEGFNSPAARAPEGGNPGTTLGAQRLNVFNQAAGIWAAFLDSTQTIRVESKFDPLVPCSASGGVLGAAGPITVHSSFPNAPFSNTWYPAALANKIANNDLGATNDIIAEFNSSIDVNCIPGTRFYYGFDNLPPPGTLSLLVVVLHELGHGLGFLTLTDESDGTYLDGVPDVWVRFMFDRNQNATWFQMTQAQRATSAINTNDLLWDGANVRIASAFLSAARDAATGRVELFTPNPVQPGSSVSHWNTTANPNLLMEPAINSGLPLTGDLTRQLLRDIGWFRDANNNAVADTITNVLPASGTLTPGSNVNITWTNPAGFSRRVTIELSTNGGSAFPAVIASDIANTGSFTWMVPNTPTTQGRIRVREHDFVAPVGVSAANFSIGSGNTAPTYTPTAAITRQRGSAGSAATIGTVTDGQTPAGNLTVTQIAGGSSTGITATSINNTAGTVSATIAASCSANAGTLRFQVSDGTLQGTGDLQVNVSNNTNPTLTYAASSVGLGSGRTINPATGPSDNGSITSIQLLPQGGYGGTISINSTTGVITLSNATPVGSHTISVRATDNCGAFTDTSFQLTVTAQNVFANGFE